jgi:hypothetical protein
MIGSEGGSREAVESVVEAVGRLWLDARVILFEHWWKEREPCSIDVEENPPSGLLYGAFLIIVHFSGHRIVPLVPVRNLARRQIVPMRMGRGARTKTSRGQEGTCGAVDEYEVQKPC